MRRFIAFTAAVMMTLAAVPAVSAETMVTKKPGAAEPAGFDGVKDTLRKGMIAYSPTIHISVDLKGDSDAEMKRLDSYLTECAEDLIGEKELFHVCDNMDYKGNVTTEGKRCHAELDLHVNYISSKDKAEAEKKKFRTAVDSYMQGLEKNWTDIQKAAYIHDRLIAETEYLESPAGKRYTSTPYAALVDHKALCTGYARAYKILLEEAGIDCRLASNDDHMWNIVKIDGKWYHTDCTYDDSSINGEQMERVIMHRYFLKSDKVMKGYYDIPEGYAVSERFDGFDWDYYSGFGFYDSGIIYMGRDGAYLYDTKKKTKQRLFAADTRFELDLGSSTRYWEDCMPQLVQYGGYLYINEDHRILRYDPAEGKTETVFSNGKKEDMIVGLTVSKGGVLYGWFADDVNEQGTKKGLIDLNKSKG